MSLETKTWRIIVADDHVVVRKGILQVLQSAEDLRVEGEAGSGAELLEQLRKETWDALVLDLHMPGVSGMDLLRQVHAVRPGLPVLILTVQPEDLYARRLLQAGASGYLTKDSVAEELVTALRKVCSGKRYVSETLAEQLAFATDASAERAPHEILSDREFEVLRLLASGMTPTAIADKLCLSVKTVST